jgi:hypothetical protein
MAERQILEGYGRSPEEQDTEERHSPITNIIGAPRRQAWHLSRDLTGSAVQVVR